MSNECWLVVESPRTGKRLSIPCTWPKKNLDVVYKARKAIPEFGEAYVELTSSDLRKFYGTWRSYKNMDNRACEEAGYGEEDAKVS